VIRPRLTRSAPISRLSLFAMASIAAFTALTIAAAVVEIVLKYR
jgi:hypothetical protein